MPSDREAARVVHAEAFRRENDPHTLPPEVGLFEALIDAADVIERPPATRES